MGLLGKLFGKRPGDVATHAHRTQASGIVSELEPALRAYQDGCHEATVAAAAPYVDRHADANRLCALSCSALGRYHEAFPYWLALFEQEPSAHNALQLATTSVMCGELGRGEAWLQKFDEVNEQTHESSSVTARANFISALIQGGYLDESLPHLVWMREVYAQVHTTDAHFLHARGIPFFRSFLEKSLPVLQVCLSRDAIVEWYRVLLGSLDAEGEAQLDEWMQRLTSEPGSQAD